MSCFDDMKVKARELVEITAEDAGYLLEALPPVYGDGCFAMGEPHSYDYEEKAQTFYWAGKVGEGWFGILATQKQAEAAYRAARAAL